jgi:dolichol-phosphate mannosyltransferase
MITVFLPAYNEEKALARVVEKFDGVLKALGETYKILVLDDGSRDQTAAIAEDLSGRYPLELLRHPVNLGLGQTMIDGLKKAARDCQPQDWIVTLDCDDTHEPRYLPPALEKIKEGFDVVILSRYQKGGGERGLSLVKSFLSRGAGLFLKIFFPIPGVWEYSCGYRVFRASALQKALEVFGDNFVRLPKMGFVVTPEILIKLRMIGARIAEVPFELKYDQKAGESKNKPLKTIAGYFALVFLYWGRHIDKAR